MTEAEKRRIDLLEKTRKAYSDKHHIPAVHPRYQSAYKSIYAEQEESEAGSSFGFRFVAAVLIFCLFVLAARSDEEKADYVVQKIEQEFQGFVDLEIFD